MSSPAKLNYFDLPQFFSALTESYQSNLHPYYGSVYHVYWALMNMGYGTLATKVLNASPLVGNVTPEQYEQLIAAPWGEEVIKRVEEIKQHTHEQRAGT